jgi:exodeoxyribonuclease VIII
MVASVHAHPLASRLLVGGESEVTLRWRDERTGVECKGRADYWVRSHRLCVDLKTCEDARPQGFAKSVANWGYFRQEAFYRAGFDACGEPLEHYWLLAVERSPPFALAVYKLTAESVELGARHNEEDLATFARCLEIGEWPAYPRGVQELALPGWAT